MVEGHHILRILLIQYHHSLDLNLQEIITLTEYLSFKESFKLIIFIFTPFLAIIIKKKIISFSNLSIILTL